MKKFLLRFILYVVAVALVAYFVNGIDVHGLKGTIISAIVIGLVNAFVKPVVKLLALPVTLLTLGLFSLVINGLMIMLCGWLVPESLSVSGFLPALIFSVALAVVTWIMKAIAGVK